jgi:hypothetical protein
LPALLPAAQRRCDTSQTLPGLVAALCSVAVGVGPILPLYAVDVQLDFRMFVHRRLLSSARPLLRSRLVSLMYRYRTE